MIRMKKLKQAKLWTKKTSSMTNLRPRSLNQASVSAVLVPEDLVPGCNPKPSSQAPGLKKLKHGFLSNGAWGLGAGLQSETKFSGTRTEEIESWFSQQWCLRTWFRVAILNQALRRQDWRNWSMVLSNGARGLGSGLQSETKVSGTRTEEFEVWFVQFLQLTRTEKIMIIIAGVQNRSISSFLCKFRARPSRKTLVYLFTPYLGIIAGVQKRSKS